MKKEMNEMFNETKSINSTYTTVASLPEKEQEKSNEFQPEINMNYLILFINETLKELIIKGNRSHLHVVEDIFYSKIIPGISIIDYLIRIVKYTHIETSTLINSLITLLSFLEKRKNALSVHNAHRLIITSIYVNAKFNEDINLNLEYYASIGGISYKELSQLELEFYFGIDCNLFIAQETYQKYFNLFQKKLQKAKKNEALMNNC